MAFSSDEDEDLKLAIRLSLQQSPSLSPTVNAIPGSPIGDESTRRLDTESISQPFADNNQEGICTSHASNDEGRYPIEITHSASSPCQVLSADNISFTLANLKEQYQSCQLCTVLWDGITVALGTELRDIMTDVDIWHRGTEGVDPLVISVRYRMQWKVSLQFYRVQGMVYAFIVVTTSTCNLSHLCIGSILPWPEIGSCPEVGSSGISENTIKQAKLWIETCTSRRKGHSHCRPYNAGASRLPKRVIRVGSHDGDAVHLHISKGNEAAQYVALSHCWGGKTPIMTTTNNYTDHIDNIPLPLPKTFMDAVSVTRKLGVEYLWIDSLCIIQDSVEDWSEQAPQMASIYGNAYCTISADAAENTSDGFVEGSRRAGHIPHVIEFTYQGQEFAVHVRARRHHLPQQPLHDFATVTFQPQGEAGCLVLNDTLTTAPYSTLFSRAWVFQERMLSRRTLHFGHSETGWECRSLVDCECSPYRLSHGYIDTRQLSIKSMMEVYPWSSILQHYTKLRITVPGDRLVAVAGLAKERYRVSGVPYYAGLWADKMIGEMLWQVADRPSAEGPAVRLTIAPTWSWASISAEVSWGIGSALHDNLDHQECCLDWRVLSLKLTPEYQDPFGATIQAILTIRGLLVKVVIGDPQVEEDAYRPSNDYPFRLTYSIGIEKEQNMPGELQQNLRSKVYWDIGFDESLSYTLLVTSHPRGHMQGIVLNAATEEDTYTRCGMFEIRCWDKDPWLAWIEHLETRIFHFI
ncbi:HET-domain-containing protein [Curvularia clavata]|uniref:HET-domain-containing protein n=1 Tax=Curvularia clavata TaxID=95742 RepID=A0A9Q8ZIK8_CURCL|nr:HET-domain-containing protein [Curvularia clavata]